MSHRHVDHRSRGLQAGGVQLHQLVQLSACVDGPLSVLFLGLRSSTRHFHPQHRHTGVAPEQVGEFRVHAQGSAEKYKITTLYD